MKISSILETAENEFREVLKSDSYHASFNLALLHFIISVEDFYSYLEEGKKDEDTAKLELLRELIRIKSKLNKAIKDLVDPEL